MKKRKKMRRGKMKKKEIKKEKLSSFHAIYELYLSFRMQKLVIMVMYLIKKTKNNVGSMLAHRLRRRPNIG